MVSVLQYRVYSAKGELAANEQLVERMVRLGRELGRETAGPEEARRILSLK
ncbi:MAG: 3-keto-5-aminohexanoate cleavage protein [Desulfobacterales bacterium]